MAGRKPPAGARPAKQGRAKRVGPPRLQSAEIQRRQTIQDLETRMSLIEWKYRLLFDAFAVHGVKVDPIPEEE